GNEAPQTTQPAPASDLPTPAQTAPGMDLPTPAQAAPGMDLPAPATPAGINEGVPMPPPGQVPPPSLKDFARGSLATTLAPADIPVAQKLRDLINGRLDRLVDRKGDRAAVESF